MSILPEKYIIQKFYEYAGFVKYIKSSNEYMACCPICHEGKSWGKKRRCYYLPSKDLIYCHNCGWSSNPLKWISYISGKPYKEIFKESDSEKYYDVILKNEELIKNTEINTPTLPGDCINLFDKNQIEFYKNDVILNTALVYLKHRRLLNAINKPLAFYLCKNDLIHNNRLIIPFYDANNEIIYYQSRSILSKDKKPKYLSKLHSEKSIFGLNNINSNIENIFIFEGPIDSCFVKNGIAVAGIQEKSKINFNHLQQTQINSLNLYNKIWVLDSQWIDKASLLKTQNLIDNNETVFIWPKSIGKKFKDFNEICMYFKINEIKNDCILQQSFKGYEAQLKLNEIKKEWK